MAIVEEKQGDNRAVNRPGVYRREDGKEMVTSKDPSFGRIQADAIIQQGYVYAGDHSILNKPETETPKK